MPVSVGWSDADKKVLCFAFEDPITWTELDDAMENIRKCHATLPHKAIWLLDFTQAVSLPAGAIAVGRRMLRNPIPNRHPELIVLGASVRVKSVGRLFEQLFGERYDVRLHHVNSEDEAWQFIAKIQSEAKAQG